MNKYLTEFIGTFFLVLTIALTRNPFAIGIMLMVMVYMGGNISGGHYNPAVTLGVLIRNKINTINALMYWIFQIAGAYVAAVVFTWLTANVFTAAPTAGVPFMKAVVAEALFTFALVSVVLNVATSAKSKGNSYYGLAIGFTVMAGGFAVGSISGGAFNPAVAIGPALFDALQGGNAMQFVSVYLVGNVLGAVVAAVLFRILNADEKDLVANQRDGKIILRQEEA